MSAHSRSKKSCHSKPNRDDYPYFAISDLDNSEVVFIDAGSMSLQHRTRVTKNSTPYPIDLGQGSLFVSTRSVNSVDVLDPVTFKNQGVVELNHHPRSGTSNYQNLIAFSGANKICMTVVDSTTKKKVTEVCVPDPDWGKPQDFGGGLFCGHPYWVNSRQLILCDRVHRKLWLLDLDHSVPLASVETSSSVHHIVTVSDSWTYGTMEGNLEKGVKSGLCRFRVENGNFVAYSELLISNGGGHHSLTYPGRNQIWFPSSDGQVHIVNTSTFKVTKSLPCGDGAGHPNFNLKYNIVAVLNHKGGSITFIDSREGHERVIDTVVVDQSDPGDRNNIAHTSWFSLDGKYFYFVASTKGYFYRVSGFRNQKLQLDGRLRLYRKDYRKRSGEKGYFIQGTGWAGKASYVFPHNQAEVM